MEEYMESILENALQQRQRGTAEVMHASALQGAIDPETGKAYDFPKGATLFMAFNHLNTALSRLRSCPKTRNHPNVATSVEKGLRRCRRWKASIPPHVVQWLVDNANRFHSGAKKSFVERLKRFSRVIAKAFEEFKNNPEFAVFKGERDIEDGKALPSSGPGSYYELFWDFTCMRFPK